MEHPYKYIGCFIESEAYAKILQRIPENRLDRVIEHPHVTFAYLPLNVNESLFHEEIRIKVTGYGNDNENEGVKVELSTENLLLQEMMKDITVPHITISVSAEGESVNTKFLSFSAIEPFEITGRFGGYTFSEEVITQKN